MGANFIYTDLKDLLPIKKLDSVLTFILNAEKPPFRTFAQIQNEIAFEISTKELNEILIKLEKDGYIQSNPRASNQVDEYWSTFDGRFFMAEQGGYMTKIQLDHLNRKKLEADVRRNVWRDNLLVLGTWLAGVGTVLLAILEFSKYLLHANK